jgi:plasmid stabilization system protein ParE
MTTVTLSKAARADLLQILRYSAKEWGADRAVR